MISSAARSNWARLNIDPSEKILNRRANKRLSERRIVPVECFSDSSNIPFVEEIIRIQKKEEIKIYDCLFSLCVNLLRKKGLLGKDFKPANHFISRFINQGGRLYRSLSEREIPDEPDILGIVYQSLLTEGFKNRKGIYYTPVTIIKKLLSGISLKKEELFLDPCCGSGMFLSHVESDSPENIYGFDTDPAAVMIAGTNLFIKYREFEFEPKIYRLDFLSATPEKSPSIPRKFDLIATNPPWGAMLSPETKKEFPEISSGESFSCFAVKSIRMLRKKGVLRYLLPESFMNVTTHKDIRKYLIEKCALENISIYPALFSGVATGFAAIEAINENPGNYKITINDSGKCFKTGSGYVRKNIAFVIPRAAEEDRKIISKIEERPHSFLNKSVWALGIVTGNNREKLKQTCEEGYEPLFTGKEIMPYVLKPCVSYILYERSSFQQSAPEHIYRSPEKLIYKFICRYPVAAYDDSGSLFLNSANILIPNIESMSIKTVMAFLNSALFRYLYIKKGGGIKVLKNSLLQLPFPLIPEELDTKLSRMADTVISGQRGYIRRIDSEIFSFFDINEKEKKRIADTLCGR